MKTEKKQAYLPDAKKMEALARFSGKIAHDLNNILGAIEGYSTLAANAMRDDDPAKADMAEIRQAVAKAAGITRQFLVFSGRGGLPKTSCDTGALVAGLPGKWAPAGCGNINIELDLRPGLPVINADPSGLENALCNLLDNSREAMPDGGTITISAGAVKLPPEAVRSARPEEAGLEFVNISVADSGKGMSAEVRERLFEPFFTTKKNQKGAGFGLTEVYGAVLNHNGWVEVASEPGRGSEFSLFLPAVTERPRPGV